ncbi:Molybdopterin-synthase adenylyltransferase [Anatilimnocola aggregata]|uniref:Molybdopterin-synthase adenylyltransferase n=1 Tax=Anatilimnocola aggregata TaxID=2528021 RepID=A0A517YDA4_9BACT|nr:HesA/MoeB/ThiF family protein [Anatilimnocola aggregata]QDU28112.1 Molybdopterin-synthase adenylyltransferase [Anatilimnocola aggregata]
MSNLPELSPDERKRYEWQLWVPDFGEEGQRRLKDATVLVSRIGGVGGTAALQLAAAGVGRLVLAHGGELRLNDLNRQLLMTTDWLGKPRVESASRRLRELNPHVEIETVAANISEENAAELIGRCDVVVSAAPLFNERLLMNREAVRQHKPLVDCAMYELEGRLTTIIPGRTPCMTCIYPEPPVNWKREFPVFSAVSSAVGSMAAMEAIKLIAKLGEPLAGRLLTFDLRDMSFQTIPIMRRPSCPTCGGLFA